MSNLTGSLSPKRTETWFWFWSWLDCSQLGTVVNSGVVSTPGLHLPLGALRQRWEEQEVGMMMPYEYHMYRVSPEMYAHFEPFIPTG